jgi:hypothetical protein
VLNNQWREALRLIGLIEHRWMMLDLDDLDSSEPIQRPLVLSDQEERCSAALHQSMKWVILGRWGLAFMSLYHAVFPEEMSFIDDSLDDSMSEDPDDSLPDGEIDQTQSGSKPAEDHSTDEDSKLMQHALAAFEAIEKLCSLCKAPYVPIPLQLGDSLGGRSWVLEDPLGEGLWQATDKSGMRGCVEEIWPLGGEAWSNHTQHRALELNGITHPHIAPIQDWGIDPETGRWFLTYPYIYGESFAERIDRAPLSEAQARSFFSSGDSCAQARIKISY